MRKRNPAPIILLATLVAGFALILSGCAPAQPGATGGITKDQVILEAGNTIDAVGKQFGATYDLYNALYGAGKMPEEQYRKFVSWATDFQVSYALAYRAFKVASTEADASNALDKVLKLKADLLVYYVGAGGKL